MKKIIILMLATITLALSNLTTVLASGAELMVIDNTKEHGYKLEIPNYIGETEKLKGYTLIDVNNSGSIENIYGLSKWDNYSLAIFLLENDTDEFPIKLFASKNFNGYEADYVEVTLSTAVLKLNEKNIEFTQDLNLGADELIDKGSYFEGSISPYFKYSYVDTCFLIRVNYDFFNDGKQVYNSYQPLACIALTPEKADEVVATGIFNGEVVPGLKEKIIANRNGSSTNKEITVEVNNKKVTFDVPPQIINNNTMVPLRAICDALNITVDFNNKTNVITLKSNDIVIIHRIGENTLQVNGKTTEFNTSSTAIDGRTLVPTRMIAEAVNANVEWINSSGLVKITTK